MASATTSGWPAAWNSAWGFASMASRWLASMIVWILCRHARCAASLSRLGCGVRAGDGLLRLGLGEDHLLG